MPTQKTMLYDDACPMCCWYTQAFVRHGLLESNGRRSFSEFTESELAESIDLDRSRDEIPLLDTEGGQTLYGIDSLAYLLGQRWPIIPRLLRVAPLHWTITRFYKLISYNRRVIAASRPGKNGINCTPHFNYFYRILYILLALAFSTYLIASFADTYLSFTGWVVALLFIMLLLSPSLYWRGKRGITYAGLMVTVLLMGGLLLAPGMLLPAAAPVFGLLALAVMIWELKRRVGLFILLTS